MFAPALRRSFSLYSRAARSAARNGHSSFAIERVRIGRRPPTRARLIAVLSFSAATFALGQLLGISVQVTDAHDDAPRDREWTKVGPHDARHDASPDTPDAHGTASEHLRLFIPTGFPVLQKLDKYNESDPQWQEYTAFSQDGDRIVNAKQSVAMGLRRACTEHPVSSKQLGLVDTKRGRIWLRIFFPHSPPREYHQTGFALTKDFEWRKVTRVLNGTQHFASRAIYYPEAATTAARLAIGRILDRTWKHVATYMSANTEAESEPVREMLKPLASLGRPPATPPTADHLQPPSSSSSVVADTLATLLPTTDHPVNKLQRVDLRRFYSDYFKTARDLQRKKPLDPPRGTILVVGQIEVVGSIRNRTFEVAAYCDTKGNCPPHFIKLDPIFESDNRGMPRRNN